MDGVNSMTGNPPDLPAFAEVARRHGALLYVDDAHGFGVIGERAPGRAFALRLARQQHRAPLRRELRQPRARRRLLEVLLLAAGLHRLPDGGQAAAQGRGAAVPLLRPSPVASLATVLAGFDVNERRGDALRGELHRLTRARPRRRCGRWASSRPNRSGLPIIEIPLRDHERIDAVGRFLFDHGVYVTLAAYPLVPKDEVGFRVQLTAANTDAEVDMLIAALEELVARGELRPRRRPTRSKQAA